jgi:ABC-2 type transport system ATP-binding protein
MIELKNLRKNYGPLLAVKDISFQVQPGEVLGFLGPNGAGKSTTMRMITGFVEPTAGGISVMGHNVVANPLNAQKLIGYLPEGAPLYGEMTVYAFLKFIGEVRGLRSTALRQRIQEIAHLISLSKVLKQPVETLSKGFKRRVGLAQALIHDPQVLILDEPTDGLDPNQKHDVRELIQNLSREKIVIISTHILEEVEALCSRVVIIAKGEIVADSTPAELAKTSRFHKAVYVRFSRQVDALQEFIKLDEVLEVERVDDNTFVLLAKEGSSLLHRINELIQQQHWEVEELHVEKGRLDDVFRRLTREDVA